MPIRPWLAALLLTLGSATMAAAQEAGPQDQGTTLILSESASREVEQDTIVARLVARAEGAVASDVQGEVNRQMAAALEQVRAVAEVQTATGGYRVHQRYDRDGRPSSWIAEQELRLEGGEPAAVLDLVGTLQDAGLMVQGLGFELSPDVRREVEDALTLEAITRLRMRAGDVADALEMDVARIAVLNVGNQAGIGPRPMLEARALAAEASPPPSAVPDRETVRVELNAEIALAPR